MKKNSIILIVVLALLVVVYLVFSFGFKNNEESLVNENGGLELVDGSVVDGGDEIFCTMDAMECPDGSFVGRIAPNCDFAPCPGAGDIAGEELVNPEIINNPLVVEEPVFFDETPELIELTVE